MRWLPLILLAACGAQTPPPDKPAPKPEGEPYVGMPDAFTEELDTGNDCVQAETECQGGVCTAKVNNNCEVPVTCEFEVMVLCQSQTDTGEAKGKGRDTIPAGKTAEIVAGNDCEGRQVRATTPETMSCR